MVPNTRFMKERRAFARMRDHTPGLAKSEFEIAVDTVVTRYNTTIRENRFTVGGTIEILTRRLLKASGVQCLDYGAEATGGDLILSTGEQISVKFISNPSRGTKLINKMGVGARQWTTATLFILGGEGIIYGDPELVSPEHIKDTGDALAIKGAGLRQLIKQKQFNCVMDVEIAQKPDTVATGEARVASQEIAKSILEEMNAEHL